MKISDLMDMKVNYNHIVKSVVDHSSKASINSVFVMHKYNHKYLEEALSLGSKTIISNVKIEVPTNVNNIIVQNTYKTLGNLLKKLYLDIINEYRIIGITGTNGKTSTTTIIYNYLKQLNIDSILIGSNGIFFDEEKIEINNTTPSLTEIYDAILIHSKKQRKQIKYLIIECSSQGIRNNRLFGLKFDAIGFTNITKDHLDFHKNTSDYVFSKALLFNSLKDNAKVIINKKNCYYELLESICPIDVISYGINGMYSYTIKDSNSLGSTFDILDSDNSVNLSTILLGEFQVENILLAYTILKKLNVEMKLFKQFIANFKNVPGRLTKYIIKDKIIYLDYGHTINAVEVVFEQLKKENKKIWTVTGCGGNRDKTKRPIIGEIATRESHYVIFTEDNNRGELFEDIVNDILAGVKINNYNVIQNRFEAIKFVIKNLKSDDVLLLLGKGIETTKTIYGNLNDIEMAKVILDD